MTKRVDSAEAKKIEMAEVEGINVLPDEILLLVLEKLEVIDRLRAQSTCQRWMRVGQINDHRYSNEVIFSDEPTFCTSGCTEPSDWPRIIEEVGWAIRSIEFSALSKPTLDVMQAIAHNCLQLRILKLPNNVSSNEIAALAQGCHKLEKVCIRSTTTECDDELAMLFRANPYLNYLSIDGNLEINGSCLNVLAEGNRCIKRIKITDCAIDRRHLEVLRDLKLREFAFSSCAVVDEFERNIQQYLPHIEIALSSCNIDDCEKALEHVSRAGESLISLSLPDYNCLADYNFSKIGQLTGLIVLELRDIMLLTEKHLEAIATNCQRLRVVSLSGCSTLSSIGVHQVLGLPELRALNLDMQFNCSLAGFTFCFLGGPELVANLMQLQLNRTPVLKDGLLSLIGRMPRLRLIELNEVECNYREDAFLEAVAKARRCNGAGEAELALIMTHRICIDRERKWPNLYVLDSDLQLPEDRAQYQKIMKEIKDNLFLDLEENKRPDFPSFLDSFSDRLK